MTLALLTIGQAPRVDMHDDMKEIFSTREWIECGVLDHVTDTASVGPRPGEVPLVSRLRNGDKVITGHGAIMEKMVERVSELAKSGVTNVLLMCTGHFAHVNFDIPVHSGEELAHEAIARENSNLIVVAPEVSQIEDSQQRWSQRLGRNVTTLAWDPYAGTDEELDELIEALRTRQEPHVVLDCFGYSTPTACTISTRTGKSVSTVRRVAMQEFLNRV